MTNFKGKYWLLALILTNLYSQPVKAQSVTSAADGTGTIINQNGNQINIQGGTLSADQINLFHSFSQFGLNQNEIANFLSNPNIQNILGRVVGGNPSVINGLIQVTGGNSNLFLMNPAGIIFGANAQLNMPASFTVTTATGIGFNNNFWFNATGVNNYAELLGNPSQFAFNVNQPGSIFNAGALQVGTGQNLSLIGGNVVNTGNLSAPEGNINITSVPGLSLVRITQPGHLLSLEINPSQTSAPSTITPLSLPQLLTGGNVSQATGVTVNSNGEVILTSSGVVVPQTEGGITVNSSITTNGGTVTLQANQDITTNNISTQGKEIIITSTSGHINTSLGTLNTSNTVGNGAAIKLAANSGTVTTGDINTSTLGDGGEINITSTLGDGGEINISSGGNITTKNLYSYSYSLAAGNAGNGGNIALTSTGGSISTQDLSSASVSNSGNTENGGNIKLSTTGGNITTGKIESNSYSIIAGNTKNAGDITLTTTEGNISTAKLLSASVSKSGNTENGGNIKLSNTGGNISTTDIESYSLSENGGASGYGGAIALETTNGNILLQGSSINTFSFQSIEGSSINTFSFQTTGGTVSFTGNVSLNQPLLTITTSSGDVIFNNDVNGTISGNNSLTLIPGAGNVKFLGKVGNLTPLNNLILNGIGMTEINGDVTTTNAPTYNNPVIINTDVTLAANNINFNNTVESSASLTLNSSVNTTFNQSANLGSLNTNITGTTTINADMTTANGQTYKNRVIANGNVTLKGNNIEFIENVSAAEVLNVNDSGNTVVNKNLDVANLRTNSTGTTTINGNVTTTNAQTYNNAVIANGDVILTGQEINFNKTVAGTGNLTLQPFTANQNINIGGVADVSTTLNLSAVDIKALQDGFDSIIIGREDGRGIITFTGITTFLDPVILRSPLGQTDANNAIIAPEINFKSPINIGADITTITPQVYNYPVLFTNNSTITSNQGVIFNKTVNGNINLNINSSSADVIFAEAVGNIQPLTSLNINSGGKTSLSNVTAASISTDAGGTTELNGNLTATAGNIQLNDPVTLNNHTILTANNSITTGSIKGNYDLTLNTGGDITFNEDLGNTGDFLGNVIINQAVNVTGKNINAASINQFATGNINLGNMITTIGGVSLNSGNNITTGNITTPGQQISFRSKNITTGNINSSFPNGGGNITILATNQIFTGQIDSSAKFGNGGNVTIDPITTIIDSINAQGGISGVGGNVEIVTYDTFRATGTFVDKNGILSSISTAGGLGGGSIIINHPGVRPFTVGNADIHGTAGAITTGVNNSILPQLLISNYTQNNISIVPTDLRPDVRSDLLVPKPGFFTDGFIKDPGVILNNKVGNILLDSNTTRQLASNQLIAGNIEGAVSSIEQSLSGEYTGYYGEKLQLDAQPQTVETIQAALRSILGQTGKRSAIFYMISQPKSLDLVIITPDGKPIHHNVKIDKQKLIADIRLFRNNVTDMKSNGYKESGKNLYNSLVAPIEAVLITEKIDTLLLSVDNNLRSLPFAALYDGKNFLVEKYNIGLIPSVSLMDTRYKSLRDSQILLMGASKFTGPNQNPLPGVMVELPTVAKEFGENRYFINQEFTIENLQKQRQKRPTQIVHLATHGEFNPGDSSKSYIQFWGEEKLQINQIRTLGFRNPPVELLVLSACRTALGNEQVELGFAGLAVQAGVKSALASLWYVSDEGTLGLMNEFYHKLKTAPIKSEALRQAQLAMIQGKVNVTNGELRGTRGGISLPPELLNIKNRNLSHPYYWSAFTMIGSPW